MAKKSKGKRAVSKKLAKTFDISKVPWAKSEKISSELNDAEITAVGLALFEDSAIGLSVSSWGQVARIESISTRF